MKRYLHRLRYRSHGQAGSLVKEARDSFTFDGVCVCVARAGGQPGEGGGAAARGAAGHGVALRRRRRGASGGGGGWGGLREGGWVACCLASSPSLLGGLISLLPPPPRCVSSFPSPLSALSPSPLSALGSPDAGPCVAGGTRRATACPAGSATQGPPGQRLPRRPRAQALRAPCLVPVLRAPRQPPQAPAAPGARPLSCSGRPCRAMNRCACPASGAQPALHGTAGPARHSLSGDK